MRIVLILATVLLTGCDYGFTFHPEEMTPEQMLQRADLVFIGVIQEQHIDSWPFFRAPGGSPEGHPEWWRPLRRRVRVETVLRGSHQGQVIDVYEVFGVFGGTTGDWNSTRDNERDLFMVRRESSRWQIVRDWWRSIYQINSGYHARLPLDESRPFWERYGLLNYWIGSDQRGSYSMLLHHMDPGQELGLWREAKLQRGLLRHPQREVRLAACWQLSLMGWGQDECSNGVSDSDWKDIASAGLRVRSLHEGDAARGNVDRNEFDRLLSGQGLLVNDPRHSRYDDDRLRLFTTINHPRSDASSAESSWLSFRTTPTMDALPTSRLPRPWSRKMETSRLWASGRP